MFISSFHQAAVLPSGGTTRAALLWVILLVLLGPTAVAQTTQPTFNCNSGKSYLFQNSPTDAFETDLLEGTTTQKTSGGLISNTNFNAFGYNQKDGYIWGQRTNTSQVVRVGSDYSAQLFSVTNLPSDSYVVGDVSGTGIMYLTHGGSGANSTIYAIDLTQSPLTATSMTTTATIITDWAVSPIDGNLYGIYSTISSAGNPPALTLYRFLTADRKNADGTTTVAGTREVLGEVSGGSPAITASNFGAVFMDSNGSFYVVANASGRIHRIDNPDKGSLTAVYVATGPAATTNNNDGARCALSQLVPTYTISGTIYQNGTSRAISGTGSNLGGALYMNLVNTASGLVADRATVASNGTYKLSEMAGSYTLVLSTTSGTVGQAPPAAQLPGTYVNTIEGTTASGDGTPDGTIALTVSSSNITTASFAVEQAPVATSATAQTQQNPGSSTTVDVTAYFAGTDADGTVSQLQLVSFPTNATGLTVGGTAYTSATFPSGGLTVAINTQVLLQTATGTVTDVFTFNVLDNLGQTSLTTGTVQVPFTATPLPITLTAFEAVGTASRAVQLSWTTASEQNNAFFEVQHSLDGRAFATVGRVVGRGTLGQPASYAFTHRAPGPAPQHYYRLRQVDADSTSAFSPVRTVTLARVLTPPQLTVAPNPTTAASFRVQVQYDEATPAPASLAVYGLLGQCVLTQAVTLQPGTNTYQLASSLPPGVYWVRLAGNAATGTKAAKALLAN